MSDQHSTSVTDRAARLRALARVLESAELHVVARLAHSGVWQGPTADRCATHLLLHSRMLRVQADHLRLAAARLEAG